MNDLAETVLELDIEGIPDEGRVKNTNTELQDGRWYCKPFSVLVNLGL